jgi:hypothetical protein
VCRQPADELSTVQSSATPQGLPRTSPAMSSLNATIQAQARTTPPVGLHNSATSSGLGLSSSLVLVEETAEDRPALDPLLGQVRDGVVGAGRAEVVLAENLIRPGGSGYLVSARAG